MASPRAPREASYKLSQEPHRGTLLLYMSFLSRLLWKSTLVAHSSLEKSAGLQRAGVFLCNKAQEQFRVTFNPPLCTKLSGTFLKNIPEPLMYSQAHFKHSVETQLECQPDIGSGAMSEKYLA